MSCAEIKKFCKLLSVYNVVRIEGSYDGSGDSGDWDVFIVTLPGPAQIDKKIKLTTNPGSVTANYERKPWRQWLTELEKNNPDALITRKKFETVMDSLFDLLPAGWEINDGSFGEVVVDVASEKITIEHNERYTDVRTENFSF